MRPYYEDDWVTIYHGDCREVVPELGPDRFSLVWTDPPYAREWLPMYSTIAELGARALRPGGHQFAYAPAFFLPEVYRRMEEHLAFWWTLAIVQDTNAANVVLRARGVGMTWKPVVWFRKPPATVEWRGPVFDSSGSPKRKASGHPWEQAGGEALRYISLLTPEDGEVLDPLLGSGTTLRAAKDVGRRAVGVEIEERWCEMAAQRCAQEVLAGVGTMNSDSAREGHR